MCKGAYFELVALNIRSRPRVVVRSPIGRLASASHRPKEALTWIKGRSGRGNNDRAAAIAQIEWDTCQDAKPAHGQRPKFR
jgi:hypothetical protein